MKRIFTFGLMLTAVFALTNCTEELVDQTVPTDEVTQEQTTEKGGIPFQIHASLETDTKTEAVMQGTTLKTKWKAGDEITVFYEIVGDPEEKLYKASGTFKMSANQDDIDKGIFSGFLPNNFDVKKIYDWYFVYGATYNETTKKTTVDIGYATIEDNVSAINHLAGINCPMYGSAKGLSGSITPAIRMRHLANLIELTIENQTNNNTTSGATPGDVIINDVGVGYSTVGTWKQTEALMGTFTLDILTGELTKTSAVTNSMSYTLKSPVTLSSTKATTTSTNPTDITVYFVTAPMDLQTKPTIEDYYLATDKKTTITVDEYDALDESQQAKYLPNIIRQDNLSFSVNGSVRPAPENTYPGADGDEYASGRIQKLTLPIKELQCPLASDAVGIQTSGRNGNSADALTTSKTIVTIGNSSTTSIKINGTDTDVYILKMDNDDETSNIITIKGFAKQMINALPLGFYASRWNDLPTAMRLKSMNMWLPEYNQELIMGFIPTGKYYFYEYTGREQLYDYSLMSVAMKVANRLLDFDLVLEDGLQYSELEKFIDASNVTFKGMVGNGYFDEGHSENVTVMYEAPVYKGITIELIDKFLKEKFTPANSETSPSYLGLKAIVNADMNYTNGNLTYKEFDGHSKEEMQQKAQDSAKAIYSRLKEVLNNRYDGMGEFISLLITSETHLMHILRDMEIEIVIELCPYSDGADINPIVFWGLDAWGPLISTDPNV